MMIKKRLAISNILMLVIPVVLILSIAFTIKTPFFNMLDKKVSRMQENQPGAYFIQDNLKIDIKKIDGVDSLRKISEELAGPLEKKGYHLRVSYNEEIVYSNTDEEDDDAMNEIGTKMLSKANSLVLEINRISIVKNGFMHKGDRINIIAINSDFRPARFDLNDRMNTVIIGYSILVIIISITIITITNVLLSSRIYKNLIRPLELLSYGSEQIKNGNLDFDMNYDNNDEFKSVCNDFDEMRMRLQESVQAKLKYEENRKELVAGISHDLRTPLTVIKGYVEGLRDGVANTPEKKKKYLDTIFNKACDMDTLVDSLFLFSKLDTGKFPFKFDIVNINYYFNNLYETVKDEFEKKGLQLSYKCQCSKDTKVNIDSREIDRVIYNILQNSIKYKNKEIIKSEIHLYEDDEKIFIEISDDGEGVKEEILDKLFISFYRGDPSRTNPNEGSGLGLAIAKYIVEAHNGEISAFNEDGLTIKIVLPKV